MAETYSLTGKRIFVAGHKGMVGSAIVRRLSEENCTLITATRHNLDLRNQAAVGAFMARERPDAVFLAAAKVGGILANDTYPADFIYDNLALQTNIIHAAYQNGVEKLVFLGSSCIYPRLASQPIQEDALLTGSLEPTNEWYAVAKIAGLKMCQAYRKQYGVDYVSAMPTNLYGPGDNYDLENSHVVPALIHKAYKAKEAGRRSFPIWGVGKVKREFLHVDDAADAMVWIMQHYSEAEHLNVGTGDDVAIIELAETVKDVVGFSGTIDTDPTKPEGTPRKLMDVSRLFATGWRPRYTLRTGLENTYEAFLTEVATGKLRAGTA